VFRGRQLRPKGSGENAKSDEHVIPDWLQRHLGVTSDIVTPTRVRSEDRRIIDVRQHTMGAFVAGTVCSTCNGGWMSRLEQEVKPVLVRLINAPQLLEALSNEERSTVARWALKTAAVLNRCSTYGTSDDGIGRRVPDPHMRTLAAGGLPEDVLVVAAACKSIKDVDFLQYALWTTPANSTPLQQKHRDGSYKIALSFRDLILIVAFYPSSDYAYGINRNHYVPLWSGRRRLVPIDHLMDDSPAKSTTPHLEGLLRNISLVSFTWLDLVENVVFTRLTSPSR